MDFKLRENLRGEKVVEVTGEVDFEDIKDFVSDDFEVGDIFSEDKIKAYINKHFYPEDIFPESELDAWAEANGWIPS